MFNRSCKICLEKDKAVASLKDEVGFLRSMLSPVNLHAIPQELREADAVLSSAQGDPEPSPEQQDLAVLSERDAILSGNY